MTLADYVPIALMLILAVGFASVMMLMSWRLGPKKPTAEKLAPYECGIVPLQEPVERFPVKFYIVAMLFVIFDVEIVIFLFAWAVAVRAVRLGGYRSHGDCSSHCSPRPCVYVWKRGALDWNVARRAPVPTVWSPESDSAAYERSRLMASSDRSSRVPAHHAQQRCELGPDALDVAGDLRTGVLCHRDDGHRCGSLRSRSIRHGGVPGLAAPGGSHDRGRPGVAEDGTRAAPGV